jgi:chromate transporter
MIMKPEKKPVTLWQLSLAFLKIGTFTIGGGYAMIPLIEREVVDKRQWIDEEAFTELLGLAQAAPGVMAMNIAVFVGYQTKGFGGVAAASLGSILPSFTAILAIVILFAGYKQNEVVERVFKGMRPAVVALIAVPVIRMIRTVHLNWLTALIPIAAVVLIVVLRISPAWTVIGAAAGGILWFYLFQKTPKK